MPDSDFWLARSEQWPRCNLVVCGTKCQEILSSRMTSSKPFTGSLIFGRISKLDCSLNCRCYKWTLVMDVKHLLFHRLKKDTYPLSSMKLRTKKHFWPICYGGRKFQENEILIFMDKHQKASKGPILSPIIFLKAFSMKYIFARKNSHMSGIYLNSKTLSKEYHMHNQSLVLFSLL